MLPDGKPFEKAILFAYSQGYRTAQEIADLYGYSDKTPVYKVLAKYRKQLPELRIGSHKRLYIGGDFIIP